MKNRIEKDLGIGRGIQIFVDKDGEHVDDGMTIGDFAFGAVDDTTNISDITCLIKSDFVY